MAINTAKINTQLHIDSVSLSTFLSIPHKQVLNWCDQFQGACDANYRPSVQALEKSYWMDAVAVESFIDDHAHILTPSQCADLMRCFNLQAVAA